MYNTVTDSILSELTSLPIQSYDNSTEIPLFLFEILAHYKKEWFIAFSPPSYSDPCFYDSTMRNSQLHEYFYKLPPFLRFLLSFALVQCSNEEILRACCNILCCFSWETIELYLYWILLGLEEIASSSSCYDTVFECLCSSLLDVDFNHEFTLHRMLLFSLQCIIRDFSEELSTKHLLDIIFKHLFDCNTWYTCHTHKQIHTLQGNGWSASMFTRLSTSSAHAMAFAICTEIHEKKPSDGKKIEDMSNGCVRLVYLPTLLSSLKTYLDYNQTVREKSNEEHNRYHLASLVQCLVICFQSVKEEYLNYLINKCYTDLIIILLNESDELIVTLSLTVRIMREYNR